MHYSQFGEDKILAEIFKYKTEGLCIEVGANDGVNDSTTMYFEEIGWECILIEPNPMLCNSIRTSRNATLIEAAASDKRGVVSLFVAQGAERAHGVSTISSTEDALKKIESYGFTYSEVKVQAKTLDDMLDDIGFTSEIDFISIDVESHEIEALRGFSIERWHPKIILIEDNSNYQNSTVCKYLKKYGYLRFKRTGVNDWYAQKGDTKLVNFNSRSSYALQALNAKTKVMIKRIPGMLKLREFLSTSTK